MARVLATALAAMLLLSAAQAASDSGTARDIGYRDLAAEYRALFEPGRRFHYRVTYTRIDGQDRPVPEDEALSCVVAEVEPSAGELRSTVTCERLPAATPFGGFPVPATDLIAGVWIARAGGLWKDEELGTPDPYRPEVPLLSAPIRGYRLGQPFDKERFVHRPRDTPQEGSTRTLKKAGGAWCASQHDWSIQGRTCAKSLIGDERRAERCFSAQGIARARVAHGGFEAAHEVVMTLLAPAEFRGLSSRMMRRDHVQVTSASALPELVGRWVEVFGRVTRAQLLSVQGLRFEIDEHKDGDLRNKLVRLRGYVVKHATFYSLEDVEVLSVTRRARTAAEPGG
jgi:hypothetical protein